MIGKKILSYEIKSLIGEGGMGNVYLGEHTSIGRKVAIKQLRPELAKNKEIRSRFKNEASVMAHLQHPGIVALFDYVELDDDLFLIMEYVEGLELTGLLESLTAPLSIDRGKQIMLKVLSAFSYAHKNGVVHRDVKPSNIIISANDDVKVLDFGIAKLVGDSQFNLTKTGTQVGTVYYMSPEQVKAKELDQRSDIYSLGVTFYELLTGFCPYKGTTSEYEVYDKIVREPLLPLTETMGDEYAGVWTLIEKATAKDPEDRFQSCEEFIRAIKNNRPVEKPVSTASKKNENVSVQSPKKKSNSWIYFAVGGAVLVVVLILVVPSFMEEKSEAPVEENYEELENSPPLPSKEVSKPDGKEEPPVLENWLSADDVSSIMGSYYYDQSIEELDARSYFAPHVIQFITKKNLTPYDINTIIERNTEYENALTQILDGSCRFARLDNEVSYWTYWVSFQCYRVSKDKIQKCNIQIETGFNQDNEIKSYKELQVTDLEFVDTYD